MSDTPVSTENWPAYITVRTQDLMVRQVEHEVVEWDAVFSSEDHITPWLRYQLYDPTGGQRYTILFQQAPGCTFEKFQEDVVGWAHASKIVNALNLADKEDIL